MNPYTLLQTLNNVRSLSATLVKRDGSEVALEVKPEAAETQQLASQYVGAVQIRAWSTDSNIEPTEGDVLIVEQDNGERASYSITRDANSSRFWRWKFNRVGYRIVFYTRY